MSGIFLENLIFQVDNDNTVCSEEIEYRTAGHIEADTKVIHYACLMSEANQVILVRADDADIFILLLHLQVHMSPGTRVMLDMVLSSKNNRRCLDMTKLADTLENQVSKKIFVVKTIHVAEDSMCRFSKIMENKLIWFVLVLIRIVSACYIVTFLSCYHCRDCC